MLKAVIFLKELGVGIAYPINIDPKMNYLRSKYSLFIKHLTHIYTNKNKIIDL